VTDRGRPLEFGAFLIPDAASYPAVLEQARACESAGLDLIGVQDHPYQRRHLDTWTLLAVLGASTTRLRLVPDVTNLPLRPPAVLAKAAASLDVMTGGRVELGLGAGAFWDAIEAMGGARRSPGEALKALDEAIAVLRLMWSGERGLRYDGDHYALRGVHSGPVPPHPIGIWIGGGGPRMLALIGRTADGWLPSSPAFPPERLADAHRRIDEAAAAAGRDPAEVRRAYNVAGRITTGASAGFLDGPAGQWVDQLTELTLEHGMDTYVVWPSEETELQIRRFGEEVAPAVRDAVAAERVG
jgi:alkanesulfonate monooxygenase SsuD/methylene tetrahydromethanopterin reductase-like flavin-dependent oxidoreductase (luciferase family)